MIERRTQTLPEHTFKPDFIVRVIMNPKIFKNYFFKGVDRIIDEFPPFPQPWEWTEADDQLLDLEKDISDVRSQLGHQISDYFYDPKNTKPPVNELGWARRKLLKESLRVRGVTRQKTFEMLQTVEPHIKFIKEKYEKSADERIRTLYDSVKHIPFSLALLFIPDLTDLESTILFKMSRDEVVERAVPTL